MRRHLRRYIRPVRLREALLGCVLLVALALGARLDRGTSSSTTASLLTTDTATPTTGTQAASTTGDQADGVSYSEYANGGGATNNVRLVNKQDDRLRVKGNIQLNRIPGPKVSPSNIAFAYGSCTDCQTLTVALQINLISRSASVVTPENGAVALNYQCTRCYTRARALQYVISVDDPTVVPDDVSALIRTMDRELKAIHADRSVTLEQANARIDAVVAQFTALGESLKEENAERTDTTSPGATSEP